MNNQYDLYEDQQFAGIRSDAEILTRKEGPAGGQRKERRSKKWLLWLIVALLLCTVTLLVLHQFGIIKFPWEKTAPQTPVAPIIAGDLFPGVGDAESGTLAGMTKEDILEQMQRVADASYFSFKINTMVTLEDGNSLGDLGIENPNYNVYPMVVRIYLGEDGSGELIYDSGGILPNQHINNAKLGTKLSKGNYKALAQLYAYDPDTHVNIFKSSAILDIVVNN